MKEEPPEIHQEYVETLAKNGVKAAVQVVED